MPCPICGTNTFHHALTSYMAGYLPIRVLSSQQLLRGERQRLLQILSGQVYSNMISLNKVPMECGLFPPRAPIFLCNGRVFVGILMGLTLKLWSSRQTEASHWGVTQGRHTGASHWGVTQGRHTGASHWGVTLGRHTGASHRGVTLGRHTRPRHHS